MQIASIYSNSIYQNQQTKTDYKGGLLTNPNMSGDYNSLKNKSSNINFGVTEHNKLSKRLADFINQKVQEGIKSALDEIKALQAAKRAESRAKLKAKLENEQRLEHNRQVREARRHKKVNREEINARRRERRKELKEAQNVTHSSSDDYTEPTPFQSMQSWFM